MDRNEVQLSTLPPAGALGSCRFACGFRTETFEPPRLEHKMFSEDK